MFKCLKLFKCCTVIRVRIPKLKVRKLRYGDLVTCSTSPSSQVADLGLKPGVPSSKVTQRPGLPAAGLSLLTAVIHFSHLSLCIWVPRNWARHLYSLRLHFLPCQLGAVVVSHLPQKGKKTLRRWRGGRRQLPGYTGDTVLVD